MTSTNVTKAAGMFLGMPDMSGPGSVNGSEDDGFSQLMNRANEKTVSQGQESGVQQAASKAPVKVEKTGIQSSQEKVSEGPSKAEQKPAKDDAQSVEMDDETKAALEEAAEGVKDVIEEELGISEEELEAIMSQLGLTQMDLLKPENIQAIVVAAAGATDDMSILTDEALYQDVQTLTAQVEEIVVGVQSELAVDDKAFAEMLQQMEAVDAPEEILIPEEKVQEPVVVVTEEKSMTSRLSEEGGKQAEISESTGEAVEEADSRHSNGVPVTAKTEQGKSSGAGAEKQEDAGRFMQNWTQSSSMDVWNNTSVQEQGRMFSMADTNRIMDQITEYMKVEVKAEMTELELRLQPESLGTLHIHLSAKEGAVTAQFMAENEAVRAVLEAQTAQLKENLNNQGIKVEAVEVTIASHEFERNFAQNSDGSERYEEPKKKGIRRIQLDEDIPLDEMELSDEDRIAAEMMEQNGNTVDYTA